MAKLINQQIAWTGKLGGMVGYSVRGKHYLRSMPEKVRNPRTPAQIAARKRFAAVSKFAHSTAGIHRAGYASQQNPYSAYCSSLWHEALTPDGEIDPRRAHLSRGPLKPFAPLGAASGRGWTLLMWQPPQKPDPDLRLCVCIYNHDEHVAITLIDCAAEADGIRHLAWPRHWQAAHLYIYAFWRNTVTLQAGDSTIAAEREASRPMPANTEKPLAADSKPTARTTADNKKIAPGNSAFQPEKKFFAKGPSDSHKNRTFAKQYDPNGNSINSS